MHPLNLESKSIHLNPDILNYIEYNQNQLKALDSTNLLLAIDKNHHYFIVDKTPIHYLNIEANNGITKITEFITLASWINGFYEIMSILLKLYDKIVIKKNLIPLYIEKVPSYISSLEENGIMILNTSSDAKI